MSNLIGTKEQIEGLTDEQRDLADLILQKDTRGHIYHVIKDLEGVAKDLSGKPLSYLTPGEIEVITGRKVT